MPSNMGMMVTIVNRGVQPRTNGPRPWTPMQPARNTPLWVSLNEIESTAVKAARCAGYGWGLAEEVGQSARWLAMRGS